MAIKVGVNILGLQGVIGGTVRDVLDVVVAADRKGVDYVTLGDHLGFQRSAHQTRRETHAFPFPLEEPWPEPIAFLSAVAALTSRIRLSTFVLIAPLRPTLLLAKQLATLDNISNGRVTMGLGVGWQEEEFAADGMVFEGRFGDLEDMVTAMRALWSEPPAKASGRHFHFEDFYSLPRPVQGADLPLLFGIKPTQRNIDRMARLANGWALNPADRKEFVDTVKEVSSHNRLDSAWIFGVMRRESGFIEDIQSGAGAVGLMQLMPATAKEVAKRHGKNHPGDLTHADNNIRLGSSYLRFVMDKFNDNQILATAAYNAGPHRVNRWLPQDITLPADVWVDTIPYNETRSYVRAVTAYTTIFEWRMNHQITPLHKRMVDIQPNLLVSQR